MSHAPPKRTYQQKRSFFADVVALCLCAVALSVVLNLVFAASPAAGNNDADKTTVGSLRSKMGDVRRRAFGMLAWGRVGTGGAIHERDGLYVGGDSRAVVFLNDGARVDVDENSLVVIQSQQTSESAVPALAVEIVRGSASGRTKKAKLAIRAGGASMVLSRGSRAKVRVSRGRRAKVDVAEGKATLATKKGKAIEVSQGQRGTIEASGAKNASVQNLSIKLRAPKADERIFFTAPAQSVRFQWQAAAGRGRYRFELSEDAHFRKIVVSARTRSPYYKHAGLAEGIYSWRVRRKSKSGELLSEERKLILVRDRPPVIARPPADSVIDLSEHAPIVFAWSEVRGSTRYRFELSRKHALGSPILRQVAERASYRTTQALEEGHYCYRVRADEAERDGEPWSQWRCFEVITQPRLAPPKTFQPKREVVPDDTEEPSPRGSLLWYLFGSVAHARSAKTAIVLRWEKIPGAAAYILEIAKDEEFRELVLKKRVRSNYYRWFKVVRRTYFWRVRGFDRSGRRGRASAPVRIGAEVSPPRLLGPKANTRVPYGATAPSVSLKWAHSNVLKAYTVEIASDASFARILLRESVAGSTQYVYKPGVGRFFWRVIGVDLDGQPTKASEARSVRVFALRPKLNDPPADQVLVWQGDKAGIELSWSKRPVGSFEIVVSQDARFKKALATLKSRGTSVRFRADAFGDFYWRVRGAAGATGWSRSRRFRLVPQVPYPLEPEAEHRHLFEGETAAITLRWQRVGMISTYGVQLMPNGDDERGQHEAKGEARTEAVESDHVSFEGLEPGHYTWTVWAVHQPGVESAKAPHQALELIRKRAEPEPEPEPEPETETVIAAVTPIVETEPKIEIDEQAESKKLETPARATFYVAPQVGFHSNFVEVVAPRLGVELSYRVPVMEQALRGYVSFSYFRAAIKTADATGQVTVASSLHVIPVEIGVTYIHGTSAVDLYGGLGLLLSLTYLSVVLPTQPALGQYGKDFGGLAVVGAERSVGPGAVFGSVGYSFTTQTREGIGESDPSGMSIVAGYRMGIW